VAVDGDAAAADRDAVAADGDDALDRAPRRAERERNRTMSPRAIELRPPRSTDRTTIQSPWATVGGIYVSGSRTLVRAMIRDGLVDELHLFVFPLALGLGRPAVRRGRHAREVRARPRGRLRQRRRAPELLASTRGVRP
jgi:hypothetical protein